jgi:hypothetical protein
MPQYRPYFRPSRYVDDGKKAVMFLLDWRSGSSMSAWKTHSVDSVQRGDSLSAFDFFSADGFAATALRKGSIVSMQEGIYQGYDVNIITVKEELRLRYPNEWVLYIHPSSGLLLGYEKITYLEDQQRVLSRNMIERIEYDVPIPDAVFDVTAKPEVQP